MADIRQIKVGNNTYDISAAWGNIIDKPDSYPPSTHTHNVSDISDIYTKENNLGYYDTITASADRTHTITRQTGYLTIEAADITSGTGSANNTGTYTYFYSSNKISNAFYAWNNIIGLSSNGMIVKSVDAYWIENNTISINAELKQVTLGFSTSKTQAEIQALCPIYIQYKLATATTEKVEKDHYARYNEHFILEHNKQEAERSANLVDYSKVQLGKNFEANLNAIVDNNETSLVLVNGIEPNKTYYFSSETVCEVYAFYELNDVNFIKNNLFNKAKNGSFTTSGTTNRIIIAWYKDGNTTLPNVSNLMLNEGTTALPYQPYEGNIIHEKELIDNYAKKTDIPTKTSQLTNDSNFLNSLPDRLSQYKTAVENIPSYNGFYYYANKGDASAKTVFDDYAEALTLVSAYNNTWAGQLGISCWSDNIAFRRKQGSTTWGNWIGIATKPWVDTQLSCNLGYYDTEVENDDGSYTITRQTGYLKLDGVKNKFDYKMGSTINAEYAYTGVINYISKPSNIDIKPDIISNNFETMSANALYSTNVRGISLDSGGTILVGFTTAIDTLDKANAYLAQNPVYIQYKLATATTERVEKNHYARYNESFILEHNKNEAKKSANLFNNPYNYTATQNGVSINIVGNECVLNGTSTSGFYNVIGSFTLKAGTYTFNQVILSGSMSGSMTLAKFGLYKDTSLFPLDMLSGTYTLTEDTTLSIVVWFSQAELTFNNYKLTYMLNEGITALPYQPYEGKVIHEKDLSDKLTGYVDTSTRQEINALKRFNSGVALKRDDTGIFQTDDGANLAIKSFGKDLHFYGKSGVENYVANAVLSFPYSGENNSYVYNLPNKSGTIALTTDLDPIKNDLTKNEYNLGAYDTIDGNVITRQTGYVTIEDSNILSTFTSGGSKVFTAETNIILPNAVTDWNQEFGTSNIGYKVRSLDGNWIYNKSIGGIGGQSVKIANNDFTTIDQFKALCPINIQYKMTTSYTEEIIEGQPLITLDQQGGQWLRDEWERGLNVFDIDTAIIGNGYDYTATASDWVKAIDISVEPNTTYTASSIISRYAFNHGDILADYNKNTITTGSDTKTLSIFVYVGSYSGNARAWFSNYMLNKGSIAYPYQAYNQNKHITNYEADFLKTEHDRSANLFDDNGTNSIQYIGHLYTNNESGYWNLTPHDSYNCFRIRVEQNKTYYIKQIDGLILRFEDINNNKIGGLDLFNIGYGAFTTPNGCGYVVFSKALSLATNVTMFNESSEPLPYKPYNQNKHITNNEALFLKAESERSANVKDLNYNNTNNGISLSIVNNKFTISGTNTKSEDLMIYNINLNPGTYTISIQNVSGTSSDNFRLVVHDHDWTYQRTVYFNANSYATFTVSPDDTNPLFLQVYGPASNNTINCSGYIMLNEGSVALPYQPYEGKVVHEKELGGYAKSIYGISQLYKHHIRFDITNGDGIECTFWSASNEKITDFSLIPQFAFSNIQVRNISSAKNLIVVQWNNDGFRFYEQDGLNELIGDMYDGVTAYLINDVSQL